MSFALAVVLLTLSGASRIKTDVDIPLSPHSGWYLSLVTASSLFMLSVHFAIPTIHRDMRNPADFNKCIKTSYAGEMVTCPTELQNC